MKLELTAKESKLPGIFTRDQNQLIDRNKLLKEGWEDEGEFLCNFFNFTSSSLNLPILYSKVINNCVYFILIHPLLQFQYTELQL